MIRLESNVTAKSLRKILRYSKSSGVMTWISPPKYHPDLFNKAAGCKRTRNGKTYVYIKIDGLPYSLSRLAFLWVTGKWPKDQIDHKNGNSLDNRWSNLREATSAQNNWNHKTRARRIQLPMGVRHLPSGRFQARIAKNNVMHHLGGFPSARKAQIAYRKKRRELFGEFA